MATLYPTADMWVAVHMNKITACPDRTYGPFDNWNAARAFADKLPGDQKYFTHILPVTGVG